MKKYLFMTVGTGKYIENGIILSIKSCNPNKIIFLATKDSIEKKREAIENGLKSLSYEYEWIEISNHEDLEKCLSEFENILQRFDLKDCNTTFDITFGSKPMSSALGFLALKVGDVISYVSGELRDESGKVISGGERIITFETKSFRIRSDIKEAINLFNKKFFYAAKEILHNTISLVEERHPLRRYLDTLLLFVDIQLAREDLLFEIVTEKLRNLQNFLNEVSKLLMVEPECIEKNLRDSIEKLDNLSKNPFSQLRLGELIASAERAAFIGRYNDASARLYRALEYIGQMKLKEFNKIDDDLTPTCRVIDRECIDVKDYKDRPLGLTEIYRCLYFLGIKSAKKIIDPETNQPNQMLSFRNKTILAHGFKSVTKEDYQKMKNFVEEIAMDFGFSTEPIMRDLKLTFPF